MSWVQTECGTSVNGRLVKMVTIEAKGGYLQSGEWTIVARLSNKLTATLATLKSRRLAEEVLDKVTECLADRDQDVWLMAHVIEVAQDRVSEQAEHAAPGEVNDCTPVGHHSE